MYKTRLWPTKQVHLSRFALRANVIFTFHILCSFEIPIGMKCCRKHIPLKHLGDISAMLHYSALEIETPKCFRYPSPLLSPENIVDVLKSSIREQFPSRNSTTSAVSSTLKTLRSGESAGRKTSQRV